VLWPPQHTRRQNNLMTRKRWHGLARHAQDQWGREWGWGVAVQSNGAYGSMIDEKASPAQDSRMRCDHCRKSFGLILHRYFRMRFCSADCLSAYQDRLSELTMVKIRCLELPAALSSH
jgi:hypothetical protein